MLASRWVQPTQPSTGAGDATPRQDSVTANREWRVPSAIGASWATGALENTAAALVTAPETATSTPGTASTGKEALLWVHVEMGLCGVKQRLAETLQQWRGYNHLKRAANHKGFLRFHLALLSPLYYPSNLEMMTSCSSNR